MLNILHSLDTAPNKDTNLCRSGRRRRNKQSYADDLKKRRAATGFGSKMIAEENPGVEETPERNCTRCLCRNHHKKRQCLRDLDGKYGKWNEIVRGILNEKPRIVQKKRRPKQIRKTKMMKMMMKKFPEESGEVCDTSEKDRRFALIRAHPENDVILIHADTKKMPQRPIWNRAIGTPQPETVKKSIGFLPGDMTPHGPTRF